MLRVYQYSILFFLGIFITLISWLLISTCMGYSLVIYSDGILAKYQNDERKYKKIMNMTKNSAKYLIIALFALILKEWFI